MTRFLAKLWKYKHSKKLTDFLKHSRRFLFDIKLGTYLNGKIPDSHNGYPAHLFVHPVNEGAEWGQLDYHHHGLTQHDAAQTDEILVI